ncbi:dual specificity phosphatase, partial [Zopfia rhizophila CBS 207.26]
MTEIVPGLFLGDVPAATCPELLRENNIDAIVSLCDTVWGWGWAMAVAGIPINRHIFIRCQDSETLDILVYMSDICDFIDRVASLALQKSSSLQFLSAIPPLGSILVHCIAGRSRSPAVIIGYLMRKYRIQYEDTIEFVRTKRRVKPNANLVRQLRIWEQVGYNVWEDDEKRIPKAPYQAYLDARAVQMR